eukprot:Anaeramoba_flamelloidesa808816_43.p2 GENE.a808816_43~~a808816_43.p2  ORF type:complete len:123 (-),score=24.74 a808816_43:875-1243(-)
MLVVLIPFFLIKSIILESSNYFNFPVLVEYTIKGIFGVLYLLQIYWTICVIKVAINFVKSGGIRDIRSDYDPNGTDRGENQEKEKEKEVEEEVEEEEEEEQQQILIGEQTTQTNRHFQSERG